MVGYCLNGYRLWIPVTNKITTARRVKFNENSFYGTKNIIATNLHKSENKNDKDLKTTENELQNTYTY